MRLPLLSARGLPGVTRRASRTVAGPTPPEDEIIEDMQTKFRSARPRDIDRVIAIQRTYYEADGYEFSEVEARRALECLLGDPGVGHVWVALDAERVVGYLVVTLGFSLEYGGRDAFVDELVFAESHRGLGLGRQALEIAETFAREQGVRALHLEVERHLEGAQRLYRRAGFVDQDRLLLTKRFGG